MMNQPVREIMHTQVDQRIFVVPHGKPSVPNMAMEKWDAPARPMEHPMINGRVGMRPVVLAPQGKK